MARQKITKKRLANLRGINLRIMNKIEKSRYPCPCCRYLTFDTPERGSYDICPICFWEDDQMQFDHPDARGGANRVSLSEARENFVQFQASERRFIKKVRSPLPEEFP